MFDKFAKALFIYVTLSVGLECTLTGLCCTMSVSLSLFLFEFKLPWHGGWWMALAAGVRLSVIAALTDKRLRRVQQEIFMVWALRWPIPTRCYVVGGVKKMEIIFFDWLQFISI